MRVPDLRDVHAELGCGHEGSIGLAEQCALRLRVWIIHGGVCDCPYVMTTLDAGTDAFDGVGDSRRPEMSTILPSGLPHLRAREPDDSEVPGRLQNRWPHRSSRWACRIADRSPRLVSLLVKEGSERDENRLAGKALSDSSPMSVMSACVSASSP